ncbi:MAG: Maf family protein [Bdellovibrionia bacterium]
MRNELGLPIVLASTSPRRLDLLKQIGLLCYLEPPLTDEKIRPGEKALLLVQRLAFEKAESACSRAAQKYDRGVILAADTVVVAPGGQRILGKPKDQLDAQQMLERLSGKWHSVLTGYCLLSFGTKKRKKCLRAVISKVKMRPLSLDLIQGYLAMGESMDKAGAYAVQGRGAALIERLEGSYTNVVGLPLTELVVDLEKFDVRVFSCNRAL